MSENYQIYVFFISLYLLLGSAIAMQWKCPSLTLRYSYNDVKDTCMYISFCHGDKFATFWHIYDMTENLWFFKVSHYNSINLYQK